MDFKNSEKYEIKILIEGNFSSGKSSILCRYIDNQFTNFLNGNDFKTKIIEYNQKSFNIQVWDISYRGCRPFPFISKNKYKGYSGFVVCYDGNTEYFSYIQKLFSEIKTIDENIPIVLALNKCDIVNKDDYNDAILLAEDNQIKYMYCSAKTSEGVDELLSMLIFDIISENGYWVKSEVESMKQKIKNELNKPKISSCF